MSNYILCTCSHTCGGPMLWRYLMKLTVKNMCTITKVLLKFSSHRTMYREMWSKKLSLEPYMWNYVWCTCSNTCGGPILWRSLMKLRIRNMYTKIKILFKFGSYRTVYREMRSKKAIQIATWTIHVKLRFMYTLSHMRTLALANETQN